MTRPDGRSIVTTRRDALPAPSSRTVSRRRCGYCGELFKPVRPHQRFCKPSCRWLAFVKRRQPQPRTLPLFGEDAS